MSVRSRSNWNLKVLVFKERGKPEYPEKNLLEQGREPTTNSTHIWRRRQDSNPGHIGGRRALSPLRHPCSLVTPFPRKPRVNNSLQQQQGFRLYRGNSNCLLQSEKLAKPEYVKNGADIAENQCWLGGTGSKGPALEV